MKTTTKILMTLLLIIVMFIGYLIYVHIQNIKYLNNINVELVSLKGYNYGVKYLYSKNLVRTDTVVNFEMENIPIPINKSVDECTYDDLFFTSFKYCIIDAYHKGYLIKKDSLLQEMLNDYYTIKMNYINNLNKQ